MPNTIEIDDSKARELLSRLRDTLADMTPLMRKCSGLMIEASQRAFAERRDARDGITPWKPLSASRNRQRAKKGRSPLNILQDSGLLKASIGMPSRQGMKEVGPFSALVGTNVPYAAAHQFGAKIERQPRMLVTRLRKDKFGRVRFASKKHKKVRTLLTYSGVYTINIPARPFLGLDDADIEKMRRIIAAALQNAEGNTA